MHSVCLQLGGLPRDGILDRTPAASLWQPRYSLAGGACHQMERSVVALVFNCGQMIEF